MKTFQSPYGFGDRVFLITDPDQKERMVIGIDMRPNGMKFLLAYSNGTPTWHCEQEISGTVDLVQQLGLNPNKN